MKANVTCEYNIDTGCVEIYMPDDSITVEIDCTAVENEVADNLFERSELDYLIYHDPKAYAELMLRGDAERYLKTVTDYRSLEN